MTRVNSTTKRRNSGFSITELLIAVGLIAILAVIAIPVMGTMRNHAAGANCIANQRSIVTALINYCGENGGRLPPYGDFSAQPQYGFWWLSIAPYMSVPLTPGDDQSWLKQVWCPAQKDRTRLSSYGINYGFSTQAPVSFTGSPPTFAGSMRLIQLRASTFLIGDQHDPSPGGGNAVIYNPLPGNGWPLTDDRDHDGLVDSFGAFSASYNQFDPRHNNSGYMALIDGSVKKVTPRDWASNANGIWGEFNQ